jgi:hypothetical protein
MGIRRVISKSPRPVSFEKPGFSWQAGKAMPTFRVVSFLSAIPPAILEKAEKTSAFTQSALTTEKFSCTLLQM